MCRKPPKTINNLVAKHMHKFNKPAVHANKKKDYKRSPKHKSRFGDCSFWGMFFWINGNLQSAFDRVGRLRANRCCA